MIRILPLLIGVSVLVACTGDEDAGDGSTTIAAAATTTTTTATADPADPQPTSPTTTPTTTDTTPTTTATSVTATQTTPTTIPDPAETAPDGAGGTATGALADADVQIETEDGTIQIGVAEVPDGVSDEFPIPDDLDVQLSSSTDTDVGFSGVSSMSVGELAAFYEAGLTDAGYEITARQEVDGVLAVYSFERGVEQGQVAISSAPGGAGSSVLVTIGDGSDRTEDSADG